MKNKLSDLRNHLFETLEALKDEEKPMDIERAYAVSEIAGQLIETAKVEVAFLKVSGESASEGFFEPQLAGPTPMQPKHVESTQQRRLA